MVRGIFKTMLRKKKVGLQGNEYPAGGSKHGLGGWPWCRYHGRNLVGKEGSAQVTPLALGVSDSMRCSVRGPQMGKDVN